MADRKVPAKGLQGRFVEYLGNQAEILVDHDCGAVAHRDAGGLLAAVLQGVETVVGQLGNVFVRSPDPEHAAFLAWGLLATIVIGRVSRRVGHAVSSSSSGWGGRGSRAGRCRVYGTAPREPWRTAARPAATHRSRGSTWRRSARAPEARTAPASTAAAKPTRPLARSRKVAAVVSTTFGGVPRVCAGPGMHCTAT